MPTELPVIRSMHAQWLELRKLIYQDASSDQLIELHRAFFAGAICALTTSAQIQQLPEAQRRAFIKNLVEEVFEACEPPPGWKKPCDDQDRLP